jgi:hypothetical protein
VQQIFTKQEINANAAGNITGLKFYIDPAMSISNSSQWVVYLGLTNKTSFSTDSDWIPSSQLTQVFPGQLPIIMVLLKLFFHPFSYNNIQSRYCC